MRYRSASSLVQERRKSPDKSMPVIGIFRYLRYPSSEMSGDSRSDLGFGEFSAFPTPANVARSLQWLRRELPLEPSRILDCYDLLSLPCIDDSTLDMVERANRLPQVIQQATGHVPDELHRLLLDGMLVSGEDGSVISTRLRSVKARAVEAGLMGANTSERTLGEIESHALVSLARVLLSQGFATDVLPGGAHRSRPQVDDLGLGYVWRSRSVQLRLYPDEPRRQTYTRILRVRATSKYTRVVSHSYRWSGYGTLPIPQVLSTEHHHSWLGTRPDPAELGSDWYVSFFHLGRALRYGEAAELEWREEFTDTAERFDNVLTSRAAFDGMEYLRFEVTGLPPEFPYQVAGGIFEPDGGRLVLRDDAQQLDPTAPGTYRYEVKRPISSTHYGLRWDVTDTTM